MGPNHLIHLLCIIDLCWKGKFGSNFPPFIKNVSSYGKHVTVFGKDCLCGLPRLFHSGFLSDPFHGPGDKETSLAFHVISRLCFPASSASSRTVLSHSLQFVPPHRTAHRDHPSFEFPALVDIVNMERYREFLISHIQ